MARKVTFDFSSDTKLKLIELKSGLEHACERFVSAKEIVEELIDGATVKKLKPVFRKRKR